MARSYLALLGEPGNEFIDFHSIINSDDTSAVKVKDLNLGHHILESACQLPRHLCSGFHLDSLEHPGRFALLQGLCEILLEIPDLSFIVGVRIST